MNEDGEKIPREREESLCPCKSTHSYATCCMPYHYGRAQPTSAEQLMRARYSAYFFRRVDFLIETTHPDTKSAELREELESMVYSVNWHFLEVVETSKGGPQDRKGMVEFVAKYFVDGEPYELHECSTFKRYKGSWKYLDKKSED